MSRPNKSRLHALMLTLPALLLTACASAPPLPYTPLCPAPPKLPASARQKAEPSGSPTHSARLQAKLDGLLPTSTIAEPPASSASASLTR